jgi:formate hydrogenlyase transcriptional activator
MQSIDYPIRGLLSGCSRRRIKTSETEAAGKSGDPPGKGSIMASVAYTLTTVPASAEREMPYSIEESETFANQTAEERSGSYIDLEEQIEASQPARGRQRQFEGIVGSSPLLNAVLDQVQTVAPTGATVLIEGEVIANAIHAQSERRNRPFIKLNCAAIPLGLLESELFGHEKGAFTGAVIQKMGRFEAANGGTLFLDEIGDIPLELQSKLLRVLQEQEFERLGSTYTRRVDVRVVAATNQDLAGLVVAKQFRMDLYYRLNVFPIALPPLRLRSDDIPVLVAHFVQKFGQRMAKHISKISGADLEALSRYPWPGNIRELQNVIERAVVLTKDDVLQLPSLPSRTAVRTAAGTLKEAEREHILKALEESNWVVAGQSGAAARLGMARTTLMSKMQKRGISRRMSQSRCAI